MRREEMLRKGLLKCRSRLGICLIGNPYLGNLKLKILFFYGMQEWNIKGRQNV